MYKYEIFALKIADVEVELIQSSDLPDDLHGVYVRCPGKKPIIVYRKSTTDRMACILAEEYAHHLFCAGDGTEDAHLARKYEQRARKWAYRHLLPLKKLVDASRHGIRNRFELAQHLEVPEDFLSDALFYYERKYGQSVKVGNSSSLLPKQEKVNLLTEVSQLIDEYPTIELRLLGFLESWKSLVDKAVMIQ